MIKGDYDRLKDIAEHNVCAEHKSPLEVAWFGQERTWILRCGVCIYTDAVSRMLSPTEEYRAGAPSREEFIEQDLKKGGIETMSQDQQVIPFELEGIPKADLATGEMLDQARLKALVVYAYKYGLDPYRGHVMVMYGKPYIGIDGYLYHAKKSGLAFSLQSRPMTTAEYKSYQLEATDHGWLATLTLLESRATFSGVGIVTYDEMTEKSTKHPERLRSPVVAAHPWQLGQKRAEWQALRRAFPIGEGE